jgi:hypothetical protein
MVRWGVTVRLPMSENSQEHPETTPAGQWVGNTHWSAVLAAGQPGSPRAAAAMEELCRSYWYPLYEQRWAWSLFERAVSCLRQQYAAAGKGRLYDALKGLLMDDVAEGDYTRLAAELDMTAGAVATAVHRLRDRYRELVREEVAHTVADPAEVEDEIRSLLAALS